MHISRTKTLLPFRRIIIALLCFFVTRVAYGQQTIVNLPSADQTQQGHLFVLHETQARPWSPDGYWRSTNFITYGITNSFEACLTAYNLDFLGANKPYTALGFGYKFAHQFLREEEPDLEIKLTGGQMLTTSLDGLGTGLWSYAHASMRLPGLHTRIAAGLSNGSRQIFGGYSELFLSKEHINFIASIEHPITKEWGVVCEWFSGDHEMGDLVPGVIFHSKSLDLVLVLGYKIGNSGGSSNGIIFEIGKTF
jgi:hypothetical protein